MNLPVRAEEGQETIVGRDLEVRAERGLVVLVEGAHGRTHHDELAGEHVVIVEALVTRAEYDLVAGAAREVRRHDRKAIDEDALNFRILFAVNLYRFFK